MTDLIYCVVGSSPGALAAVPGESVEMAAKPSEVGHRDPQQRTTRTQTMRPQSSISLTCSSSC